MNKPSSRRQFLRGLGGFSLALPFMPSLLSSREARAAGATGPKRFVQIATEHGGVWGRNMWPADATLTQSQNYVNRTIKRGDLALQVSGGTAQLSPVLRGSSTVFTPGLAAKMNLLRGLDVPWYIAHHTGGHLGNFARNDGNGSDGVHMQGFPTPTIDQLMAFSPNFYGDLSTNRQRVLTIGSRISFNFSDPVRKTGSIQEISGTMDALGLFNRIFVPSTPGADPNERKRPIADRVLDDYKRLRQSDRRLSNDDRRRLDDHMQRLSELQRKLNALPPGAQCSAVDPVTTNTQSIRRQGGYDINPGLQAQVFNAMNDVIVAAFMCDTSRIAVMRIEEDFSTFVGDWHQDVAHHAVDGDGVAQGRLAAAHQLTFAASFLDLAAKLDVDDGTGKTYLDNSLVVWTQESGEITHDGQGIPVVTAGSAGGFLTTGNYCDYRNPNLVVNNSGGQNARVTGGLLWQQWLGTVLQSMGLQRNEYESNGLFGYPTATKFVGNNFFGPTSGRQLYPDALWNVAGEILPYLKA